MRSLSPRVPPASRAGGTDTPELSFWGQSRCQHLGLDDPVRFTSMARGWFGDGEGWRVIPTCGSAVSPVPGPPGCIQEPVPTPVEEQRLPVHHHTLGNPSILHAPARTFPLSDPPAVCDSHPEDECAQIKPRHLSVFVRKVPLASSTSSRLAQRDTGTGRTW